MCLFRGATQTHVNWSLQRHHHILESRIWSGKQDGCDVNDTLGTMLGIDRNGATQRVDHRIWLLANNKWSVARKGPSNNHRVLSGTRGYLTQISEHRNGTFDERVGIRRQVVRSGEDRRGAGRRIVGYGRPGTPTSQTAPVARSDEFCNSKMEDVMELQNKKFQIS